MRGTNRFISNKVIHIEIDACTFTALWIGVFFLFMIGLNTWRISQSLERLENVEYRVIEENKEVE